jgi:hypothetical protein
MKHANLRIRTASGAAAVVLALAGAAGCTESPRTGDTATVPGAAAGMGAGPSATTPAAAATAAPSATASPVLADGRSAAYLTGLDTGGKTVTFDLIEFLTGDAAEAEWKKQHPGGPEGPDNGYLIVNNNKKLRTLPVAADAKVQVLATLGSPEQKAIGFAALPASLKEQTKGLPLTPPHITAMPFWLTVKDGTVTRFEEQFLP